jgi:uncharacterized membrane protein
MKQWYCVVQGQRYGPIAEAVLRDWIAQGRLAAHDLVWAEGMPNWVPAVSAMPWAFPAGAAGAAPGAYPAPGPYVPPPAYPGPGLTAAPRPGGTRGRTPNWQLTAQARQLLAGNWGLPLGFCLLISLMISPPSIIPLLGLVAVVILVGPFMLAQSAFFLTFARRGPCTLGMMFAGFQSFGQAVLAVLLASLFVMGWTILFSSAGIIVMIVAAVQGSQELVVLGSVLLLPGYIAGTVAQLAYSQTLYLMADDRRLDAMTAIWQSKELMRGFKWKFFCLSWRFFGWALLCMLTCGIGFLWLTPYMNCAFARFHDDLLPPLGGSVA